MATPHDLGFGDLVDPNPDIHEMFVRYNLTYFEGRLERCTVAWSSRMSLCAGTCSFSPREGMCQIRLSEPLLKFRPKEDLIDTLLHEMIHAYLFLKGGARGQIDRDGHGPAFQDKMNWINSVAGTRITVYHSFHAEVDYQRQHWWRCEGPCRNRPPYHGWVKRCMNRAPGPSDRWWSDHQGSCGGKYVKVKEPEKKVKPPSGKRKGKENGVVKPQSGALDKFFKRQKTETKEKETEKALVKTTDVIKLDEDDEDDADLKLALALSLQEQERSQERSALLSSTATATTPGPSSSSTSARASSAFPSQSSSISSVSAAVGKPSSASSSVNSKNPQGSKDSTISSTPTLSSGAIAASNSTVSLFPGRGFRLGDM